MADLTPLPAASNVLGAFAALYAGGSHGRPRVDDRGFLPRIAPVPRLRYGAPDRPRDANRYRSIHDQSGWFDPASHDGLTRPATNQLWRNCLLAAAAEMSCEFDSAEIAVVAVGDDPGATKAIEGVHRGMVDPARCRFVPLEQIVGVSRRIPALEDWSAKFEARYLVLDPVI